MEKKTLSQSNQLEHSHFEKYSYDKSNFVIVSGSEENNKYTEKISKLLTIKSSETINKKFKNGETYVRISEPLRSKNLYIVQSINPPIDTRIMEIALLADAAKRASAKKVSLIYPCLPYSRQDRISDSREPISAKVLAKIFDSCGIDEVITVDLHSDQIAGFYDESIKIDNLPAKNIFAHFLNQSLVGEKDIIVISPDAGGTKRAEQFSRLLKGNIDLASMQKKREAHNECVSMKLIGDVEDKIAIIYDDILDTGGTILKAAEVLRKNGAKEIYIAVTHGLFTGDSIEKFASLQRKGVINKIYVTDSVRLNDEKYSRVKESGLKLCLAPLYPLIADCIARLEVKEQLSELFNLEYIEKLYSAVELKNL